MRNNDTMELLTFDAQFYYDKLIRLLNELPENVCILAIDVLDDLIDEIINND